MIDPATGFALGSLIIAAISGYTTFRRWLADRRATKNAEVLKEYNAPAERDSFIVSGATEAVASLQAALAQAAISLSASTAELEIVRSERDKCKGLMEEQDKRINFLENQIFQIIYNKK